MLSHNRLIEKLQDRVEDGRITQEEADDKEARALAKAKATAKKRADRLASEAPQSIVINDSEVSNK